MQIDSLPAPPSGSHYELWLRAGAGEPFSLGTLPAATGPITLTGSTDQPLLANYDSALVSVEPDEDSNPGISEQIVLSGSLPVNWLAPIRQLYFDDGSHGHGSLEGARHQAGIAMSHNSFIEKALADDDMATAQNHAEHVINITVGERSLFYQDWDRDGRKGDPGDGYGVLVYLDDVAKQSGILSDTLAGEPDGAQFLPLTQQIITLTLASQDSANNASDRAMKIVYSDTSKEAQVYAEDVAESLAKSQQAIEDISHIGLQIAEIRLFASEPGLLHQQPSATTTAPAPEPTLTTVEGTAAPMAAGTPVTTPVAAPAATTEVTTTAAGAALSGTITGTGWLSTRDGGVYGYVAWG